jgi:hypothetical protein
MATAEKKGKFENEWDKKHNKKIHRTPKAAPLILTFSAAPPP